MKGHVCTRDEKISIAFVLSLPIALYVGYKKANIKKLDAILENQTHKVFQLSKNYNTKHWVIKKYIPISPAVRTATYDFNIYLPGSPEKKFAVNPDAFQDYINYDSKLAEDTDMVYTKYDSDDYYYVSYRETPDTVIIDMISDDEMFIDKKQCERDVEQLKVTSGFVAICALMATGIFI